MMIQKTYTLTDIVNGIVNWVNSLDTKSFFLLALLAGLIVAEKYPNAYYKPKPLPRKDFSESTQTTTLSKQGHRCNSCRRVLNVVNFDHIDGNRSNNDISNCQALCPNCHAKKTRN